MLGHDRLILDGEMIVVGPDGMATDLLSVSLKRP